MLSPVSDIRTIYEVDDPRMFYLLLTKLMFLGKIDRESDCLVAMLQSNRSSVNKRACGLVAIKRMLSGWEKVQLESHTSHAITQWTYSSNSDRQSSARQHTMLGAAGESNAATVAGASNCLSCLLFLSSFLTQTSSNSQRCISLLYRFDSTSRS